MTVVLVVPDPPGEYLDGGITHVYEFENKGLAQAWAVQNGTSPHLVFPLETVTDVEYE